MTLVNTVQGRKRNADTPLIFWQKEMKKFDRSQRRRNRKIDKHELSNTLDEQGELDIYGLTNLRRGNLREGTD